MPLRTIACRPPPELALGLRHDDTLLEPAAPPVGGPLQISLWARADVGITGVELRSIPDGEEELDRLREVERRGRLSRWAVVVRPRVTRFRYRFRVHRSGGVAYLTMRGLTAYDPSDAFDFTVLCGVQAPDWPPDAVIYQIFPDRFAAGDPRHRVGDGEWEVDGQPTRALPFGARPLPWREGRSADFCGGDLAGIEAHLDHLERLGASALFLNPIWPARTNHRYDVIEHGPVDPHLGGDAALASLAAALRARSMRLLLDVVLNHCGSSHPWFQKALADRHSPAAAFFFFDEWPTRYQSWLGHRRLPRLNLDEPALRERLFRGPDSWLRRLLRPPFSVDGYRFDVANMMGRSGAVQGHRPLWSEVRAALKGERADAWLFGEHFFDPDKLLKGDGLDGVMGYHGFTRPLRAFLSGRERDGSPSAVDGADAVAAMREVWSRVGFSAWRHSTLHVNSHDLPRLQSFAGGLASPRGRAALEIATTLQLGLPGVPSLYYGDEVGLEGGEDPDNRRCMEWERASWDQGLFDRTAGLVGLRRRSLALRRGGVCDLGSHGDLIALARVHGEEVKLVLAFRGDEPVELGLDLTGLGRGPCRLTLAPRSALILDADAAE